MSSAKSAFGSKLKRSGVAVAELTGITINGQKVNMVDATNHDSANGFAEFIAGIADGGEFGCEGNFLNTGAQASLISDMQARTSASYVAELGPVGSLAATITATCFVTAFDIQAPHDGKLGFSATLKVTGKPVYS